MKTYLELVDERNEVNLKIVGLISELSDFPIQSTDYIAIETAVSLLRINLAQVQRELLLRFAQQH